MKFFVINSLFLFLLISCNKSNVPPIPDRAKGVDDKEHPCTLPSMYEVPDCIQKKILSFNAFACKTGASVIECKLNGQTLYQFNPGKCGADMPTETYDSNCNIKCSMGGFAGRIGDKSFCDSLASSDLKYVKIIWSN